MTTPEHSHDFAAALEAQAPFLSRLARSLIADEHAAADAVQDTMLSAWSADTGPGAHGPNEARRGLAELDPGRLRAWLATVLRRKSVSRLRSAVLHYEGRAGQAQDGASEVAGTTPGELTADAASTPERVVLRLERQALLHQALQSLPEAYRTAIVLRYQDSMGAAEIASELNANVATVRSRIQRGLQSLRTELDRVHGESGQADPRASWLAALAPLAFPESKSLAAVPAASPPGAAGIPIVLAMKKLVLVCVTALAVAGAGLLYRANLVSVDLGTEVAAAQELKAPGSLEPLLAGSRDRGEQFRTALDQGEAGAETGGGSSEKGPLAEAPGKARAQATEAAAAAERPPVAVDPGSSRGRIAGRATLVDGTVLAGVKVTARKDLTLGAAPLSSTVTDENGAFTLTLDPDVVTEPVTVLIANEFHIPDGAVKEDVPLGKTNLIFQVDALLIRLFPDDMGKLKGTARGAKRTAFVRAEAIKPEGKRGNFIPFSGYHTSTEATSCRLLRPGVEYLFTAVSGEFGKEEWTAVAPKVLQAGVHELLLKKDNDELASYTAHATGEVLGAGEKLSLFLGIEKDVDGQEVEGPVHGVASFKESERTLVKDGCVPGTSFVNATITARDRLSFLYVTNPYQDVKLVAGENTEFSINLARGGRFSVHAARADGASPDGPLHGTLSYRYLRGGPPGAIGAYEAISQLKQVGRKGRWAMAPFVELGETFMCDHPLHPGTIELELYCRGYEESKQTVEIVAGEITACTFEL